MVITRSTTSPVTPDPNRIIAVVTGANSGCGLGICQQLLRNLSLPPSTPMPASIPQPSALAPSQRYLLDQKTESDKRVPPDPPPTLTLILACRSASKAEIARRALFKQHEKELSRRQRDGQPARAGWRDKMRIVSEVVDLDSLGGKNGVLAFCERMKETYPHITTLYLNAGLMAYTANNFWLLAKQVLTDGFITAATYPRFYIEEQGRMSADGERGMVWGVNVLAPYILAKELLPLLERSPSSIPMPPRIIYTSTCTATLDRLKADPLSDYQLLSYSYPYDKSNYAASKYMADLVMVQIDKEVYNAGSPVRCLTGDPGIVMTNIGWESYGPFTWLRHIIWWSSWLSYLLARLLGSPRHFVDLSQGALAMVYAALVDERYLQPPTKVPAQKFESIVTRWGWAYVRYGEVDRWEEVGEIGRAVVRGCEAMRVEWRRREGME